MLSLFIPQPNLSLMSFHEHTMCNVLLCAYLLPSMSSIEGAFQRPHFLRMLFSLCHLSALESSELSFHCSHSRLSFLPCPPLILNTTLHQITQTTVTLQCPSCMRPTSSDFNLLGIAAILQVGIHEASMEGTSAQHSRAS